MLGLFDDVWSLLLSVVSSALTSLPIDEAGKFTLFLIAGVSLVAVWCVLGAPLEGHFSVLTVFLAAATLLLVIAPNLALFFIAWEIVAIICWAISRLVNRGSDSVLGALPFQALGGLAMLAMFAGLLWLAVEGHTVDFGPVSVPHLPIITGLITFALLGNTLSVLTQSWHDTHPRVGPIAAALLSTVGMVALGIYPLIRLLHGPLQSALPTPVPLPLVGGQYPLGDVLLVAALVVALVAALAALGERDMYRVASYTALTQFGIFVAALIRGGEAGVVSALWGYTAYCAAIVALYLALGHVERATGERLLDGLGGLAAALPATALGALLAALALSAFPPFAAFGPVAGFGQALLERSPGPALPLLGAALACQFMALLRLLGLVFGGTQAGERLPEGAANTLIAIFVLGLGSLSLGLDPSRLLELMRPVVGQLAG